MGGGGGSGKSSGNSNNQTQLTPDQARALNVQTNFLQNTALPAYQKTIGQADTTLGTALPATQAAADTASGVAGTNTAIQQGAGAVGTGLGIGGLASLFSPQYEQQQVQAALQPTIEQARESYQQNNATEGAAGGMGSSRDELAKANLDSLNRQRMGTVAATTQAGIETNRANAATQLANIGSSNLVNSNASAASRINYAQSPLDTIAKYAGVIFGTPQANTTPNFTGTQSSNQSGSSQSSGFKMGIGKT